MSPFEVAAVAASFLLSIIYSASEAALLSMTTKSYNAAQRSHPRSALVLERLLGRPRNLMVTILVVNMTANGLLVAIMANRFVGWFGLLRGLGLSILVLTAVVALFAEILPKVLATKYPVRVAVWTAYPVWLVSWLTAPVIAVTDGLLAVFVRPVKAGPDERTLTEEELRTYLVLSQNEGVLAASEGEMISSVFEFSDTVVREVMTPRTDIDALPESATLEEFVAFINEMPRSRVPIYRDHLDEIIGIVYAKDVLPYVVGHEDTGKFSIATMLREPYFVPEVMKCDDLLRDLRLRRLALAVVVDEYGGTAGIVSIEDLLEEIFGDIQDETDEEEMQKIQPRSGGGWLVDARIHIEEANDELPVNIPEGEFDTVGGFVFDRIGHLPSPDDDIVVDDVRYLVKEMDGHRISLVEIVPEGGDE